MPRAAYVCTIGCATDCKHGHPCVIGSMGRAEPHDKHLADAGDVMHEWREGGRCRRVPYEDPADHVDDPPIELIFGSEP